MQFTMNKVERARADHWLANVALPAALEYQRATTSKPDRETQEYWVMGQPKGASVYYTFSNSSGIGQSVEVSLSVQGFKISSNVTDYDTW